MSSSPLDNYRNTHEHTHTHTPTHTHTHTHSVWQSSHCLWSCRRSSHHNRNTAYWEQRWKGRMPTETRSGMKRFTANSWWGCREASIQHEPLWTVNLLMMLLASFSFPSELQHLHFWPNYPRNTHTHTHTLRKSCVEKAFCFQNSTTGFKNQILLIATSEH